MIKIAPSYICYGGECVYYKFQNDADGPGKASSLCDDLLERCLEESFFVPPKKGEEGGFRCNSDSRESDKSASQTSTRK
jgi:hypothetical protein